MLEAPSLGSQVAGAAFETAAGPAYAMDEYVESASSAAALALTYGGAPFEGEQPSVKKPEDSVTLVLFNANTDETIELPVARDGRVASERREEVEEFFKCRRSGRSHAMAAGVLRVVAAIGEAFPGHVIEIISGYRASPYGVKHSKHFEGRAIDLRVRGVKLSKVRDWVWRNVSDVGVGYYAQQRFIHVDFRPEHKDTAWSSAHENAQYEYNPHWALRIRPPWREPAMHLEDLEHEEELDLAGVGTEHMAQLGTTNDLAAL